MSQAHMNEAVRRLYAGSIPGRDFVWGVDPATDELAFLSWSLSGSPDMTALDAECAAIEAERRSAGVAAERDRRLAGGFSFDFGDGRGVHVFATTEADLRGWREVGDYAEALRANGDTVTTIAILTETGATTVTAAEWANILIAASAFRQPIWAASFVLQAMDPIPSDYIDDGYWPA